MALVLSEWPSEIKTRTGTGDLKILDGEDVVVLRRSATDCRQELKSCPPSVRLKLLFVEYILESIKRLPVLSLIFIGYQKLAPCLFMFLIILESSHLLRHSPQKDLFVLISSISMEFYCIWNFFTIYYWDQHHSIFSGRNDKSIVCEQERCSRERKSYV